MFSLSAFTKRILASCHEDPLLGVDGGNGSTKGSGYTPHKNLAAENQSLQAADAALESTLLPGINDNIRPSPSQEPQQGLELEQDGQVQQSQIMQQNEEQQQQEEQREQEQQVNAATEEITVGAAASRGADEPGENIVEVVDTTSEGLKAGIGGGLALWPESTKLPSAAGAETTRTAGDGVEMIGRGRGSGSNSCCMDAEVLKSVARLFLSKLQISVEVSALCFDVFILAHQHGVMSLS